MQHSIVARYASWSGTRFAPTPTRARARRLGLRGSAGFVAAATRRTVLRRLDGGPLTELRASGHAMDVAAVGRADRGLTRGTARMLWTRSAHGVRPRRSSAAPAWRA